MIGRPRIRTYALRSNVLNTRLNVSNRYLKYFDFYKGKNGFDQMVCVIPNTKYILMYNIQHGYGANDFYSIY